MHLHQARLAALILLVSLLGCRTNSAGVRSKATTVSSQPASALTICEGRATCKLLQTRKVESRAGDDLEIVDLGFRHPSDAGEDVVRCDRREYWLVRSSGKKLIATDCAVQWGADSPGPAETAVEGYRMTFHYLEHGSSDTCETYVAVIDLLSFRIESEKRLTGDAKGDGCVNMRPVQMPTTPGDGTSHRPLVTLHAEGLPIEN